MNQGPICAKVYPEGIQPIKGNNCGLISSRHLLYRLFNMAQSINSIYKGTIYILEVLSSFRLVVILSFRYFMFSLFRLFVFLLFRLFAWRHFVFSSACMASFRLALFRREKTK